MSFAVTNAVLLPFVLALGIPLLIHLLARAKPPLFEFGSIEFIERIVRQSVRARRPRDLLLLLLRTLLCAALVALFLRPVWFPESGLASSGKTRNLVVILDATASMGYIEGSQTRFANACAGASEVLAGLGPRDRANVIWLRTRPTPVFPALGTNHAHLRTALRSARPTLESGDPRAALNLAARMLENVTGRREICIVSDFQATAWHGINRDLPEGVDVVHLRAGAEQAENCAITRIGTSPPTALAGEDITVHCDIANFSAQRKAVTVTLSGHGVRRQQETMLEPWQTTIVPFVCAFDRTGELPVKVSLGEDAFPPDNVRWGLIDISSSQRVGLADSGGAGAVVWRRVLNALDHLTPEPWPTQAPRPPAIVVLADWGPGSAEACRAVVDRGGTVVGCLGPDTPISEITALLNAGVPTADGQTVPWETRDDSIGLTIAADDSPYLAIFAGGSYGTPTATRVTARGLPPQGTIPLHTHVLRYTDGVPALAVASGKGHVVIWNMPLDPESSGLARQAELIPLVGELISKGRSEDVLWGTGTFPGQPLSWETTQEVETDQLRLQADGEAELQLSRPLPGVRAAAVSEPVARPGLYRWTYRKLVAGYGIVNFPPEESDLRALDPRESTVGGAVTLAAGTQLARLHAGIPLWPRFLAAALCLVVIESLVLLRSDHT